MANQRCPHHAYSRTSFPLRLSIILLLSALLALSAAHPAQAAVLAEHTPPPPLPGAVDGAADWGDYDKDGDLDLLITGLNEAGQRVTTLFQSNKGTLTAVESGLPPLEASSVDWGDYDNDGYLDVLVTGMQSFSGGAIHGFAGVYHNQPHPDDGGKRTFTLAYTLPPIYQGWGEWADFDADGRADILITGYTDGGAPLTRVYRNTRTDFADTGFDLEQLGGGGAAWGDYDGDNFPDMVIFGRDVQASLRALVYRNNSGTGFHAPIELDGVWSGSAAWIDADNDDTFDLLITGNRGDNTGNIQPSSMLYRFDGSTFQAVENHGLPGIWRSSTAAGDYDGDGRSDLLVTGLTFTDRITRIYLSQGDFSFIDAEADLPGGAGLSAAWGDFDGDFAPDIALTGVLEVIEETEAAVRTTQVITNPNPAAALPAQPQLTAACWDGADHLTFYWDSADSIGTTYNLRAGNFFDMNDIVHPQSSTLTGLRKLAQPGNAYSGFSAVLRIPPYVSLFNWSVQGVNAALAGGPFSTDRWTFAGFAVANNDEFTTPGNTPISLNLLKNDFHLFGPPRIFTVGQPAHGTLSEVDGLLVYTPEPYFFGQDSFSYQAVSGGGLNNACSAAAARITVERPDTPVSIQCVDGCGSFTPDPKTAAVTMSEDSSPTPFTLTLRGDDTGMDEALLWEISGGPANGTAAVDSSSRPGDPVSVQYTPDPDWFGADTFTISVRDPWGNTDSVEVQVEVQPVNDAPTLDALPDMALIEWTGEHTIQLSGLTPGPANESGQALAVSAVTDRPDLLRDLRYDPGAGGIIFRLDQGTGEALVTITVDDGQDENNPIERTLRITVTQGVRLYIPLVLRP